MLRDSKDLAQDCDNHGISYKRYTMTSNPPVSTNQRLCELHVFRPLEQGFVVLGSERHMRTHRSFSGAQLKKQTMGKCDRAVQISALQR